MLLEPPTDTQLRYRGSVANRAWHPPFAPEVFWRGVTLKWWLDPGRMRSLTEGVCIKLLTKALFSACRKTQLQHGEHQRAEPGRRGALGEILRVANRHRRSGVLFLFYTTWFSGSKNSRTSALSRP